MLQQASLRCKGGRNEKLNVVPWVFWTSGNLPGWQAQDAINTKGLLRCLPGRSIEHRIGSSLEESVVHRISIPHSPLTMLLYWMSRTNRSSNPSTDRSLRLSTIGTSPIGSMPARPHVAVLFVAQHT